MHRFSHIIGHKRQIAGLQKAVKSGRVAHAYLFMGPPGVGKRTVALALAASLLCDKGREGDACGVCGSCRQVKNNNHPDLFPVAPRGASLKIEQIRELQKRVMHKPYQNKCQVFIIEAAESMTREAANCFLKVLEEPPVQTVFILLTGQPDLLLPTVVSRCQHLVFNGLTQTEITTGLTTLAGVGAREAYLPVLLARGSLGRALAYVTDDSPAGLREQVINLACSIRRMPASDLLDESMLWAENKNKAWEVLETLFLWYRDVLIWQQSGAEEMLFNRDKLNIIAGEVEHYTTGELISALERLEAAKSDLLANGNPRLIMDVVLLSLTGPGEGGFGYAL